MGKLNILANVFTRRIFNCLTNTLNEFSRSQSGNIALVFALTVTPVLVAAGGAIDYSALARAKSDLQNVLDASVLAGAVSLTDPDEAESIAGYYYDNHLKPIPSVVTFSANEIKITGLASGSVPTSFLGIIGIDSFEFSVEAIATIEDVKRPACFLAMHPTRKHTLELKQKVSVIAPDCNIYGNSNHPWDVVDPHTKYNKLIGKTVQAIGYGHHYLENVFPPLEYAPELIPDPLASMTIPSADSCDYDKVELDGETTTLNPGTYCNGLEIADGSDVKLNPGVYIIADKEFKVEDSKVTGDGVTIVLADDRVELAWKNSEIRLRAPVSGPYSSMVMMGVREDADHEFEDSIIDLHGIIYLPNGAFKWTNTGSAAIDAKWTVFIVDGVSWYGDGEIFINFKPEESNIPYMDALNVIPVVGLPRLVN